MELYRTKLAGWSSENERLCSHTLLLFTYFAAEMADPHAAAHNRNIISGKLLENGMYHMAGKFGGEFNLVVWRIMNTPPN